MTRACDLIVSGGLFALLLFTPFAFGAVHPWAYIAMESAIFLLAAVALAKLIYLRHWPSPMGPWIGRLALPLGLFVGLLCCQVLPLPPPLINLLSPESYRLYQTSLPGWPDTLAYAELVNAAPNRPVQARLLPTLEELRRAPAGRDPAAETKRSATASWQGVNIGFPKSWRPLSIAPSLTFTDLNKFLAYGALFFLLLLYPFGDRGSANGQVEHTFLRSLVLVLLAGASSVALVGVVQHFAGNGKILWHFVPYDWAGPATGSLQRASGPFVNPDHFANYLALIFPLAVALAVNPRAWFAPRLAGAARLYCAVAAGIIFMALLVSLSRFGWLSALLGLILLKFWSRQSRSAERIIYLRKRTLMSAAYGATAIVAGLFMTLWLIGPQARQAIDQRLADGFTGDGTLTTRLSLWHDTLPMIRDFPWLGVGLGTWSELFPRYQRSSPTEVYFREAHNDFVELLAETGVIGFALLGLFFFRGGRMILASLQAAPAQLRVVLAPALAGLAIMLAHECFDFSLQIPANALLFTVLLGVAIRLAARLHAPQTGREVAMSVWLPASGIALATILIALSFTQDWLPYPYNLRAPLSVAEAAERIERHPAQAAGHALLATLIADRAPLNRQIDEYAIAAQLQPADPRLRDLYAGALLRAGRREQGLNEIRRSVALAPALERHFYLDEKILPFLAADERQAIAEGFHQAIARGDLPATDHLARFYERTGQPLEQAKLLEAASARAAATGGKSALLLKAAQSYVAANQPAKAETLLKQVIADDPKDPRSYQGLIRSIYAPQGERQQIAATLAQARDNRVDVVPLYLSLAEALHGMNASGEIAPALQSAADGIALAATRGGQVLPLYLALAETAQRVGARASEQQALEKALELRPNAAELLYRLGQLYLIASRHDRAAYVFKRLSEVAPQTAAAYFQLGRAEEGRFDFAQADKAYARAVQLEPENPNYVKQYSSFKARLAQNLPPGER